MSASPGAVGPSVSTETGLFAGTRTLLYKEVLRFWKVSFQTVAAPVLTAMLYLLIFGHVLEGRVTVFDSVGYTSFLIPGLVILFVCGCLVIGGLTLLGPTIGNVFSGINQSLAP